MALVKRETVVKVISGIADMLDEKAGYDAAAPYMAMTCLVRDNKKEIPDVDAVPVGSVRAIIDMMRRVVNKYEKSQERVIWEYSGRIQEDEAALHKECREYRKRIKRLLIECNNAECADGKRRDAPCT